MTTVEPIRNLEHLHKLEDYLAKKSKRDLLLFNEYLEKESLSFKDLEYQDIRLFYNYMDLKNYNKNIVYNNIIK